MIPFDWETLPLSGERLVEASAGTGKTWAISSLYVRLLLGHGSPDRMHPAGPLDVRQILVVTFTIAATAELRERIRRRLGDLSDLEGQLGSALADPRAAARLRLARASMDEASILTIHGFCQQVLRRFPETCGMPAEWDYVIDDADLWRAATVDFWRRKIVPFGAEQPHDLSALVDAWWSGPDALAGDLADLRLRPGIQLLGGESAMQTAGEALSVCLQQFADYWESGAATAALAAATALSRAKQSPVHPDRLAAIDAALEAPIDNAGTLIPHLMALGHGALGPGGSAVNKRGVPLEDLTICVLADALAKTALEFRASVLREAHSATREIHRSTHRQLRRFAPDDLVERVAAALRGGSGQRLASSIRKLWPAAMIDEFQDTDAAQCEIFERVYGQREDVCSVAIGDPKQSIFGFRGADLFSYLQARERLDLKRRHTMTHNWRSTPACVAAVAAIFSARSDPFELAELSFADVTAVREQPVDDPVGARLWVVENDTTRRVSRAQLAAAAANRVRELLRAGAEPGAVALIVRSRAEAEAMQGALKALGVASAWVSREPVLRTAEAADVLLVLRAMLEPGDARRIRAALGSALFARTIDELPEWLADDDRWATAVGAWRGYRQRWGEAGVLAALWQCLQDHGIPARLLATDGGARRLTDLRHIAELLSRQAELQPEPLELCRWLQRALDDPTENEERQLRLETDEDLVRIVTVHGSKGLEYELVLLPFISLPPYRRGESGRPAQYHARDGAGFRACADLTAAPDAQEQAEFESQAEEARLLYVALTRARQRLELFLGAGGGIANTALGRLLVAPEGRSADAVWHQIEVLPQRCSNIRIDHLATESSELEGAVALTAPAELPLTEATRELPGLRDRWRISSYSALTQGEFDHAPSIAGLSDEGEDRAEPASDLDGPARFPRGALAGVRLHELLERWPASPADEQAFVSRSIVGLGSGLSPVETLAWLRRVRTTPLLPLEVSLADPTVLAREMEFHLRVPEVQMDRLRAALRAYALNAAPLALTELRGLLRGFVDLVFVHAGAVYVADYKSNWLAPMAAGYTQDVMQASVYEHRYDLQQLIYAQAVLSLLRQRAGGELTYGGGFTLFLRGMDGAGSTGVLFTPPNVSLQQDFEAALGE